MSQEQTPRELNTYFSDAGGNLIIVDSIPAPQTTDEKCYFSQCRTAWGIVSNKLWVGMHLEPSDIHSVSVGDGDDILVEELMPVTPVEKEEATLEGVSKEPPANDTADQLDLNGGMK